VTPAAIRPAADRQEAEIHDTGRARNPRTARRRSAAGGTALGRREEAFGAPALLVQLDEGVQVRDRVRRSLEADLAGGLGPADLAPDLVALLLVERAEVAS
jgi:hypothetical protein